MVSADPILLNLMEYQPDFLKRILYLAENAAGILLISRQI